MFDPYKLLKFSIRLFSRLAVIVYSYHFSTQRAYNNPRMHNP